MLHLPLSLMNRLNKTESAIFNLNVCFAWFGCPRRIDLLSEFILNISFFKQFSFVINNLILGIIFYLTIRNVSNYFIYPFEKLFFSTVIGLTVYISIPIILRLKEYKIINSLVCFKITLAA